MKPFQIHRGRPILYGCGDFLTDYEGISGHETFRPDLTLAYLIDIDPQHGHLSRFRMLPMKIRRFRLETASKDEADWLAAVVNRLGGYGAPTFSDF